MINTTATDDSIRQLVLHLLLALVYIGVVSKFQPPPSVSVLLPIFGLPFPFPKIGHRRGFRLRTLGLGLRTWWFRFRIPNLPFVFQCEDEACMEYGEVLWVYYSLGVLKKITVPKIVYINFTSKSPKNHLRGTLGNLFDPRSPNKFFWPPSKIFFRFSKGPPLVFWTPIFIRTVIFLGRLFF